MYPAPASLARNKAINTSVRTRACRPGPDHTDACFSYDAYANAVRRLQSLAPRRMECACASTTAASTRMEKNNNNSVCFWPKDEPGASDLGSFVGRRRLGKRVLESEGKGGGRGGRGVKRREKLFQIPHSRHLRASCFPCEEHRAFGCDWHRMPSDRKV
jgi:hypothetical protein